MNVREYKILKFGAVISFIAWIVLGYLHGVGYVLCNVAGAGVAWIAFGVLCECFENIKVFYSICTSYIVNIIVLQLIYAVPQYCQNIEYTWQLLPFVFISPALNCFAFAFFSTGGKCE